MKNHFLLFIVSFVFAAILTGCSTTPKYAVVPVVYASTNYAVAQPPVRLEVENKGRQWNQFVRDYNAERLEHNLRQAQIENRGAEQNRAKELGVEYASTVGQQITAVSDGPTYEVLPSGTLRLAPSQSMPISGFVPSYWYSPPPTYEVLPSGALRLAPSYGNRWNQFFDSSGSGFSTGGAVFGGASFRSGLGNPYGNGQERLFGVPFQKSSPGYKDFWGIRR